MAARRCGGPYAERGYWRVGTLLRGFTHLRFPKEGKHMRKNIIKKNSFYFLYIYIFENVKM